MSASWYWTPPSPKPYILTSPTAALEQSLRAVWDAASRAAVRILPQIKLTSQLSSCASVFSRQSWWPMKQPRVDFLPATGLHKEPELLYQQRPLAPIRFLGECRRIWVKSLLVLESPVLFEILSFIWRWRQLPVPSHQERLWVGGAWVKHPGHTHSWSTHWEGLSWKIQRNSHPVKSCWVRGWLKHARRIAHPVERYWGGGLDWEKKSRNTQGSAERCWGRSVVGDWTVLAEWLSKRLIWH